jgi:Tol biopolymer transport system component
VCQFGSRDPVFSPDGSRILFVRDEDKAGADGGVLELQDSDLWVMRANGARQRRLVPGEEKPVRFAPMTPDGHVQVSPTWSPDGRFVATMISHRHDAIQVFDTRTGDWHYISDPGSSVYDSDLSWSADWTILRMGALPSSAVMRVD